MIITDQPLLGPAPVHVDDDNPFLTATPQPVPANVRFDLPSTPPSVGAETFTSPSPSHSELNGYEGNQQSCPTIDAPSLETNATPSHRTQQAHTCPTQHTPRAVTHIRNTPCAGRHSTLRSQHQEQRRADEVKKLKARDVWSFFKKDERGQHVCLFCKYVISSL